MNCLHCTAETTNGLALCERCQAAAAVYLEFLPIYFHNLTRWRPGHTGSRQVPGSREPSGVALTQARDEQVDRIELALDDAAADLIGWAMCVIDDRPGHLARTATRIIGLEGERRYRLLCAFFDRHLVSVATTPWVGELVRGLRASDTRLRRLTEEVAPGWYAGACTRCETPTYVIPGLTWVTCRLCGTTTNASAHLDIVLDEARDWIARPAQLAAAVVALVDAETSIQRVYDRIHKWGKRGRIQPIRRTTRGYEYDALTGQVVVVDEEVGFARYRLGDVLDRLAIERSAHQSRERVS